MDPSQNSFESIFLTDPKYIELRGRLYSVNLTDVNTHEGSGVTERHWGIKRPHLNRLLDYCFKNFDYVCVWSAGHYKYVVEIVNNIFHGIGKPHLIFTRDNIRTQPNGDYHKPLQEMLNHPVLKDKVTMADTVFLDDRVENFITCKDNGIVIPKFKPSPISVLDDDICLLQLEQFFRSTEFQNSRDVRRLNKSQIFNTPLRNLPPIDVMSNPLVYATEVYKQDIKTNIVPQNNVNAFTYSMPALVYVN